MLTPLNPVHLSGPSASTAQLVASIRQKTDPAPQCLGTVVYLLRKASPNGSVPSTVEAPEDFGVLG
jgi:hypothetical protein